MSQVEGRDSHPIPLNEDTCEEHSSSSPATVLDRQENIWEMVDPWLCEAWGGFLRWEGLGGEGEKEY